VSQHLPDPKLPAAELNGRDRATSSDPAAPGATSGPDSTHTEPPPVRDALRAIARLLGRQAARDHMARED
jgi:hypothetical protein